MSNGTQLNKSLSVGHIVATVGLIIGGFTFIYDLRESVAIQSFQLENVEDRLERVVARTDDQSEDIHEIPLDPSKKGSIPWISSNLAAPLSVSISMIWPVLRPA